MGLVERKNLVAQLAPPIDNLLATQLVDEFVSVEKRFIQRDWEPTELDGGQFCEILARIVYHLDSGNLNLTKKFEECVNFIDNEQVGHNIKPRSDAKHLMKVLHTIYRFRSQRGAVHISPTYTPNQMDSKFMVEGVRWCMNETLRIFWKGDREIVAKTIREILQFDVPAIGVYEDIVRVLRTDLTAEEQILILLHYAGDQGFTRTEIGRHSTFPPPTVTRTLQKLSAPNCLQVIKLPGERYRLTELGSKRIRTQLAEKLLLE
jgi:hypothetical protein